jgi:ATP-GRASP peptide maturase of grasp-with-spasm system
MILIFGQALEQSTTLVIDWIRYLSPNVKVKRISEFDLISDVEVVINDNKTEFYFKVNGDQINFNEVNSFWYRRADINYFSREVFNKNPEEIKDYLIEEWQAVKDFIHYLCCKKVFSIGNINSSNLNKLVQLDCAKNNELWIPNSLITDKKKAVVNFFDVNDNIITKGINDNIEYEANGIHHQSFTELVENKDIDSLEESIDLSIFQNAIPKKYDIRVFYIHGTFYAVAIFSQLNNSSKTDHRKFDTSAPPRMESINLPKKVLKKLEKTMIDLNVNIGCIDLILTKDNKYVFLEVNPDGIFNDISIICNLNLERVIAEQLING